MDEKIEKDCKIKTDAEIKKDAEKLLMIGIAKNLYNEKLIDYNILTKVIAEIKKL